MRHTVVVPSLLLAFVVSGCKGSAPEAEATTTAVATAQASTTDEGGCHDAAGAAATGAVAAKPEADCAGEATAGAAGNADHAAVAATHGAASTGGREQIDADGIVRRGTKLSDAAALTVADVIGRAGELDGKPVKITGRVESVCQAMGCWFTLQGPDGGQTIRISSKGHDMFVPKAAAGRQATVEGEFKVKTVSKAQAQHFEDERALKPGETRKTFTEDVKELSIAIVALEMRPSA